MLQDVKIQM